MKLLTKTDSYTQMVSAFVSCFFGVGLKLNEDQLREVNKRMASHQWGKYVSNKEAIEINGTDQKSHYKMNLP